MDCAEAKLRIEPFVTGTLPGDETGALESHLAACAECRLDTELTRAAHSPPSAAPLPPSQPADPPEPPPTAASASGWTIDSIFGAPAPGKPTAAPLEQVGETAPPESPNEAPPPEFGVPPAFATTSAQEDSFENVLASEAESNSEPDPVQAAESHVELPTMLDGPEAPPPGSPRSGRSADLETEDEDESSGRSGWDFEPADQKDGALPPEGSLFFAEEALSRSGGRKKKGKASFIKVALWIVGGVVGLGLLGVSVWIALAVRGETAPELAQSESTHPGPKETPLGDAAPPTQVPPDAAASGLISPAETNARTNAEDSLRSSPSKTAVATKPGPSKTPVPSKPDLPQFRSAQSSAAAARTARELAALPTPWRNPPPRPNRPRSSPIDDDDDFRPIDDPKPTAKTLRPLAPERVKTPPTETATFAPTGPDSSAAPPTPENTAVPAPDMTAQETSPPALEMPQHPLDRIHVATLEAEQNADVPSLRKLRDTWRGLVRNSVGPDRARAKRELADCLWAVQTLTTRTSDQKAALAAYRDYILNAPAGGADTRTVARMRQLEDALSESH